MTTQTIRVLADRLPEARHALDKLIRKAHRYGCPDVGYTASPRYTLTYKVQDWDGEWRTVSTDYVDLTVTGEAPRVGNYEFLARVENTENGRLIDTVPGVEDLDPRFREFSTECEHCRKDRRRSDLYIVRDRDTGQQMQIGRTCLRDFLGTDSPASIAQRFEFYRVAGGGLLDEEGFGFGQYRWGQSLEGLMVLAATAIRLFGWCSKGQAGTDERLTATATYVNLGLRPADKVDQGYMGTWKKLQAVTDADRATATATIDWVRNTLANQNRLSDYENNLVVLFRGDYVTDQKRLGLTISGVSAYHRALEIELRRTKERTEAAASVAVGTVGERLKKVPVTQVSARVVGSNNFADCLLVKFKDDAGNIFTWFTGGAGTDLQNGERALLTGTVKGHKEYNGATETQLSRCKIDK